MITGVIGQDLRNVATGGAVTTFTSGGKKYKLHSYTSTGSSTFTVNRGLYPFELLIVGAGGSAGSVSQGDGAGGAGGVLAGSLSSLAADDYQVVVGAFTVGSAGGSSQFGDTYIADGGGLGGVSGAAGGSGGSGAGGAGGMTQPAGGAATQTTIGSLTGYGNAGSAGTVIQGNPVGGAGGGAGSAPPGVGLPGGSLSSSITGTATNYSRGGWRFTGSIGISIGVTGGRGDGAPPGNNFWTNADAGDGVVYVRYEVL